MPDFPTRVGVNRSPRSSPGAASGFPHTRGGEPHAVTSFYFHVEFRALEFLMHEGDAVIPTKREVALAEQALAWVLLTLANDGDKVGLRRPAFR